MTLLPGERQALAWLEASRSRLFVVALGEERDEPLFTEGPEEQGLGEDDEQVYLIRVFTTRVEADRYRETQEALYPYHFAVKTFSGFETLWPELVEQEDIYTKSLGVHIRAVLSVMPADEHPEDLDTLFSRTQLKN